MTKLNEIVGFLDDYLKIKSIPDYPNAYNGLQAGEDIEIKTVAAAVDADIDSIKEAIEKNVDLLIVHHGLFWQGVEPLTGSWREKCNLILESGICIYSSHIPLDIHPEVGNSALLAKALNLKNIKACHPWKGVNLAIKGNLNNSGQGLTQKLQSLLGKKPTALLHGEEIIDELYIITGGAGGELANLFKTGAKNFLTGEGSHWNTVYAKENKMNLFLAWHYLNETFGIKEVTNLISRRYKLKTKQISHPKIAL